MLILIIAGGPDKGRIYELNSDTPIVLGREGDQVKLNDRKASREHARLWCEGGQWYLEDLGSRHGTYRNHNPIDQGQRAKLKDGDYIQVGNSVMVLGRMPAEHAEKLALIAKQSAAQPTPRRRWPVVAGAVSVAALIALGGYVAVQLEALRDESVPRAEFAQLQRELIEAQRLQADRIEDSFDQHGRVSRDLISKQQQLANTLGQTTQAIGKHGDSLAQATGAIANATDPLINKLDTVNTLATSQQRAIERLGEMLNQQQANDNSDQLLAAVNDMKKLLGDQPLGDTLVARLEEAIKTNADAAAAAVRLALAEQRDNTPGTALASNEKTEALLQDLIEQLAAVPTRKQIAEEMRLAMLDNAAQNEQFMRLVLAELRSTGDQITTGVAAAIDEDAGQTQTLVQRTIAEQIAQELSATDNEAAAKTASLLEQVLSKVNEQQQLSSQITQLRTQIQSLPGLNSEAVRGVLARLDQQDRNNAEMLQSIAQLRAAMPDNLPGQLDKVLAQLDEQVRTEQIVDAIERSMQRIAAANDQQTQAALAGFAKRIDSLPSADQLEQITKSQEAMAKLLDQSETRESISELRAALDRVAGQLPDAENDRLNKVLAMLKQREKADLLLAELHDAMDKQSADTDKLREELLDAVAKANNTEDNQTLNELLGLVRDRLITDDSVRQAIRDELHGTLLPNQKALNDARDVTTSAPPSGTDQDTQDAALPRQRLTRLEAAYKRAFENGKPVTIGAGAVDPDTGEVSAGRLIDPEVAKALGFETWRDWYLTDRHAEQMRLQQQALRQRNNLDAKDAGTIKLPPSERERERVEQD